ncbi:MAG: hypothetical protein ACKVWV_07105 [Planctomycetota bacterium]
MSSEHALLDADFEALLREVAANPRSSLLRVERPRMLPELFDERVHLGSQRAGLTSAERHLLQVHRGEVAWLLREACMIKLIEGPRNRRYVSPYSGPGKKVELLSDRQLARRVDESEDASRDSIECLDGLELLQRCVADRVGEEPNVAELATASLRLEPSDQARLMVGLDLTNRGAPRSALELLRRFMDDEPSDLYAAIALEYMGRAFTDINPSKAFDAYKRSSEQPCGRVWSLLSRQVFGFQLGIRDDALVSSRMLAEHMSERDPVIDLFVDALTHGRRMHEWSPTPVGLDLARSLQDSLNAIGRRVADVFR